MAKYEPPADTIWTSDLNEDTNPKARCSKAAPEDVPTQRPKYTFHT